MKALLEVATRIGDVVVAVLDGGACKLGDDAIGLRKELVLDVDQWCAVVSYSLQQFGDFRQRWMVV